MVLHGEGLSRYAMEDGERVKRRQSMGEGEGRRDEGEANNDVLEI